MEQEDSVAKPKRKKRRNTGGVKFPDIQVAAKELGDRTYFVEQRLGYAVICRAVKDIHDVLDGLRESGSRSICNSVRRDIYVIEKWCLEENYENGFLFYANLATSGQPSSEFESLVDKTRSSIAEAINNINEIIEKTI